MLTLKIKSAEGKLFATMRLNASGAVEFVGDYDPNFFNFISMAIEKGITQRRDIYDHETQTATIIELPIKKGDSNFPLAMKGWITRQGYKVTELHPEVEEEIKRLLQTFPDDNADKADILKRLPEMSYLEMTTILEGLEKYH